MYNCISNVLKDMKEDTGYTSEILWVQVQTTAVNWVLQITSQMRFFFFFLIPSTYKTYVYTLLQSINCVIPLCLKNNDMP